MAPVIAIGSSALVAGTAASAGATAKKLANPTVKISVSAPGAFRFTLNGIAVSFKGSYGVFKAKIGVNHVTEISAPPLYRSLSAIAVSPASAEVSSSLTRETVAFRLAAGKSATILFKNTKLVVVVSTPAPVPPINPGPSTPPPSGSGGGTPPVTNPDPGATGTTGYIEVCKTAGDKYVEGTFSFTITSDTTVDASPTLTLPEGAGSQVCTGPITVPAGTVTVAEGSEAPAYSLSDVYAWPTDNLVSGSVTTTGANFTVTAGLETTAYFTNSTNMNSIKVCKDLANNMGSLAGTSFAYDVSWTFTPPTQNLAVATFTGGETDYVTAVANPGEACSVSGAIPVGSVVDVSEEGAVIAGAAPSLTAPYVSVSGVLITPDTFNDGSTATEAILTVPPTTDGYADARFWNLPMGSIEVCKYFDPKWYDNGKNSATFTVTDGTFTSTFTLSPILGTDRETIGDACSAPMAVPAGTATVQELNVPSVPTVGMGDFYLEGISTVSAIDPGGIRLLNAAASGQPANNPASVSVPYGGAANTTEVDFVNAVDPTQFKICTLESASDDNLGGQTVDFSWSSIDTFAGVADAAIEGYPLGGEGSVLLPVTSSGDPTGVACTNTFYGPPAVDSHGDPYSVTITEESITGPPPAAVTGITYSGAGWAGEPTLGVPPEDGITVEPGVGLNLVTFTNGATS
jgi:hypothetical protein